MSRNTDLENQTMAATGARKDVFAAKDVRTLIANNLRSLTCLCPASQRQVDLQVYADHATLARIRFNSVRFQCPHCGGEHETKVGAARQDGRLAQASSSREVREDQGIARRAEQPIAQVSA